MGPKLSGAPSTEVRIGKDGSAAFLTSIKGTELFERTFRLSTRDLILRLELQPASEALLELATSAGWADECVVTQVDASPQPRTKGQTPTMFAGTPEIRLLVVPDKLRSVVAAQGLPESALRLRARIIDEHLRPEGRGEIS